MSCIVINESGRKIHVTVDRHAEYSQPLGYNMVISKDALDSKRHLEHVTIASKQRKQLYSLINPFKLFIENRLPSSSWEAVDDQNSNDLIVVVDDIH